VTGAPRLEIDLDKIYHNARTLVERLQSHRISLTGVTKAVLGSPDIARVMLRAGAVALGDSRIENIESLRRANVLAPMTLIRSPMMSQAFRVVKSADVSCNTDIEVIRQLSIEARRIGRDHHVILMVELGDLREGIMPGDLAGVVDDTRRLPNIHLKGIGTNLACRSGVTPDAENMARLSTLVDATEARAECSIDVVSGGNSANLNWLFAGAEIGRINNLRIGEAILLGRETLFRQPVTGLFTDAFTLFAEVIESKLKPTQPTGTIAQTAFGLKCHVPNRGDILQSVLAIGAQDIDPDGLTGSNAVTVLGASSDHLIVESARRALPVGSEVAFQLDYAALLRAMTSPFVSKVFHPQTLPPGNSAIASMRTAN
jgi:ornithine racemase